MISLKFIPLTFITSNDEIIKQIRNTVVFSHLFETCKETTLKNYIESTQYGFTASALENGSHKMLRITDINHGKVNWENVPFCDCENDEKYLLEPNDILVARTGGTTGKSFIVQNPPSNAVYASYLIRIRLKDDVNIKFINAFLNSYCFWSQITEMKSGSAQPNVNAEKLKTLVMPDCDLETQKKAVSFLNDEHGANVIREKIDSIEKQFWNNNKITSELSHQLELVSRLRQAFLREAMQGKLVPQYDADEPAAVLLEKIKAEKYNRLSACSGDAASARRKSDRLTARRTKQKPVSEIKPEEIPFEIPNNWTWCRLGELIDLISGQHIDTTNYNEKGEGFPYLTGPSDFGEKYPIPTRWTTKPKVFADKDDILITVKGSGVGKTNISNLEKVVISRQLMAIRTNSISRFYLHFFLDNSFDLLQSEKKGTGIPGISRENILEKVFPLPPLAEQKRIVEKLEKLMKFCDELEANIKNSKQNAEVLLQVALKEALET